MMEELAKKQGAKSGKKKDISSADEADKPKAKKAKKAKDDD